MSFDATTTAEEVTDGLDLSGQTLLVTGCNSGLGLETTRVLALRGARIVGLARTAEKARAALDEVGAEGDAVACDLSDLDSVRAAVQQVRGLAPLDALIANAGIMALPELQQIAGIERQLFVNHIGHFVLVTGLLDRLTPAGRVVMVSSGAHRYAKQGMELDNVSGVFDYDPWRMYGRSKLANILFARSLQARFEGSDRVALSLHPGVIETNLGRHIPDREAMYERMKDLLRTVGQGAATQVFAAVHPDAAALGGAYLSDCAVTDTLPQGQDDALAAKLWAWTEKLVA